MALRQEHCRQSGCFVPLPRLRRSALKLRVSQRRVALRRRVQKLLCDPRACRAKPSQAEPSQAKRPFGLAAVVECILTQRWQKATSATVLNVYQPCAVLEAMSCAAPHCAVEQQSLLLRNLLEQSAAHEVCLSAFRSVPFRSVPFRFGSSHRQMRRPVFRQHGQIVPCCSTHRGWSATVPQPLHRT
jgi:hypothetical protein